MTGTVIEDTKETGGEPGEAALVDGGGGECGFGPIVGG